jgi:hypothetical protein
MWVADGSRGRRDVVELELVGTGSQQGDWESLTS